MERYLGVTIPEWIVFVWVIFSVPLYILLVIMLIKKRNHAMFSNCFFTLCVSLGFFDLIHVITHYPFHIWSYWCWVKWDFLLTHPSHIVAWLFRLLYIVRTWFVVYGQFVGVLLLAVNRLWTITKPLQEWGRKGTIISLAIHWGTALVITTPFYIQPLNVTVNSRGAMITTLPLQFSIMYILTMGITVGLAINITVCILYINMYLSIRKHNQAVMSTQEKESQKSAIRLAFMGFTLFLFMFGNTLYLIVYVFISVIGWDTTTIEILWNQWGMIFALINPYLLLICSKPTRTHFRKFLGFKDHTVGPTLAQQQLQLHLQNRNVARAAGPSGRQVESQV